MNAKNKRVLTVIRCSSERMVENMHKSKYIAMVAAAAMALTLAGCGSKGGELIEVTPTPMATPTPTVVPATVTPLPTSTPAPKMIGTKTAQAKFIYLSNSLQSDIRELYLRTSGNEDGDWGKNLISMESSIKAAEQVQMYYGGETSSSTTESGDSSESTSDSTSANYDMKLVTADGNSYEIYSVNFGDMEKASLMLDDSTSSVYLRYMSLSTKKETDTRGNSAETNDSSDDSSDDSSSDSSSSDSSSGDSSDSYDSSSDSSSDSSDSYDSSYDSNDDSSDDSSYDDSSDNSDDYDDGNYDDSYDDSYDGSYDDGSSDDGYVDEGYDTDESSSSDWDY